MSQMSHSKFFYFEMKQAHFGKYLVMWCAALLENIKVQPNKNIVYFVYNLHNIDNNYNTNQ